MDAITAGFDLVYQIDQPSLLGALEGLVADPVTMRLQSIPLAVPLPAPAPANTVQNGTLTLLSAPMVTLAAPAPNDPASVALTIAFPQTSLALSAVPAVAGLGSFAGIGGLVPTAAGQLSLTLTLQISAQSLRENNGAVQIALASPVSVLPLSSLPNLSALSAVIDLAAAVQSAVQADVATALAPLFPIAIPIPFGAPNLCGIGVRELAVKLLSGSATTKPALGFFLTLLQNSTGTIGSAGASSLTVSPNVEGALALSNAFLQALVCCLVRTSPNIVGLPAESSDSGGCCTWSSTDNVQIGGKSVRLEKLQVCVVPGTGGAQSNITFDLEVSQSGTGYTAYAEVSLNLGIGLSANALSPVLSKPIVKTWYDLSWWVYVLSIVAVVAGLLIIILGGGSTLGAVIALAGALFFALESAVGSLATSAVSGLEGALGAAAIPNLVPAPIIDNFGAISGFINVDFDDLYLGGTVQPPSRGNVLIEGSEVILGLGDSIDLDGGVIERAGQSVAGFALEGDLQWHVNPPVSTLVAVAARAGLGGIGNGGGGVVYESGSIVPLGTARLVALGGTSFWSITESALSTLLFPGTRTTIEGGTIVVSQTPYPPGARVFAVHTTDGRLAKCVAWQDDETRLHLSYVTYNTPVPLAIGSTWTSTRGPIASSGAFQQTFQVARTGTFTAITRGISAIWFFPNQPSLNFTWLWNGASIAGSGVLPDGTTHYAVAGATLTLETAMGTTLDGVLQVEAVYNGAQLVATLDIDEPGTVRERIGTPLPIARQASAISSPSPASVTPDPIAPPLIEQLTAAFARGMDVAPETVTFR